MKIHFGILPKEKHQAVLNLYPNDFKLAAVTKPGHVPRYVPSDKFLRRLQETLQQTGGLAIIENKGDKLGQQQLRQIALAIGEALASKNGLADTVRALARNPFNPSRPYPNLPKGNLFLRVVFDPFRASAYSPGVPVGRKPSIVPHATHGHFDPIHGYQDHFTRPSKGYLMVGIYDGKLPPWFKQADTDAIRYITDAMEILKAQRRKKEWLDLPPDFGDYGNYLTDEQVKAFGIPIDRKNGSIVFHTLPFMHSIGPDSTGGVEGAPYGFLGISVSDFRKHCHPWTDEPIYYNSNESSRQKFLKGRKTR